MAEEKQSLIEALANGRRKPEDLSAEERSLLGEDLRILERSAAMGQPAGIRKEEAWHALQAKMEESSENKQQAKVISLRNPRFRTTMAAILIIGLGISLYTFLQPKTYTSPIGERSLFELPDGSTVILSPGSVLSSSVLALGSRHYTLEGEAYFSVKSGEGAFQINTDQFDVKVLGTQFNVNTRKGSAGVACAEGKVAVYAGEQVEILSEGEGLVATGGILQEPYRLAPKSVGSWREGIFSFNNAPLEVVFREVELYYKVRIRMEGSSNQRFTGSFTRKELDDVLQVICLPLGLAYTIDENQVSISNH